MYTIQSSFYDEHIVVTSYNTTVRRLLIILFFCYSRESEFLSAKNRIIPHFYRTKEGRYAVCLSFFSDLGSWAVEKKKGCIHYTAENDHENIRASCRVGVFFFRSPAHPVQRMCVGHFGGSSLVVLFNTYIHKCTLTHTHRTHILGMFVS